jgi:hypothetical protein
VVLGGFWVAAPSGCDVILPIARPQRLLCYSMIWLRKPWARLCQLAARTHAHIGPTTRTASTTNTRPGSASFPRAHVCHAREQLYAHTHARTCTHTTLICLLVVVLVASGASQASEALKLRWHHSPAPAAEAWLAQPPVPTDAFSPSRWPEPHPGRRKKAICITEVAARKVIAGSIVRLLERDSARFSRCTRRGIRGRQGRLPLNKMQRLS